jgi:hypothetical protein
LAVRIIGLLSVNVGVIVRLAPIATDADARKVHNERSIDVLNDGPVYMPEISYPEMS